MRKNLKPNLFGAFFGAVLLVATSPSWGVPLSVAPPEGEGSSTLLVQQGASDLPRREQPRASQTHHPSSSKKCLKWTRRWNPRYGVGRRRCVQWR